MHSSPRLAAILVALSMLSPIPLTSACLPSISSPALEARSNTTAEPPTYPIANLGPDTPSDPSTTGYFLNHLALKVSNLTRSKHFYTQAFGLREILTLHITRSITLTYMGHTHGGRNASGYQTAAEMNRQKNNVEGLLELLHVDVPPPPPPPPPPHSPADKQHPISTEETPSALSHIGIVVPSLPAAQKRLESLPGVQILKKADDPFPFDSPAAIRAFSLADLARLPDPEERELARHLIDAVSRPTILVLDPDGNVVEVQPAVGAELISS